VRAPAHRNRIPPALVVVTAAPPAPLVQFPYLCL